MRTCCLGGAALCLFFSLQAMTACSVKEDRSACPCYASVLVEDFLRAGFSDALLSFSSDRLVHRESIRLAEFEDDAYVASLERRTNRASLIAGMTRMRIRGDSLLVPYGHQSDPIWLYSEKFFCDGDSYTVTARPHKQFCRLEILLKGLSAEERTACTFRVKAGFCGLDLYSRRALEGEFCAEAIRGLDGAFSLLLPRQGMGVSCSKPPAGSRRRALRLSWMWPPRFVPPVMIGLWRTSRMSVSQWTMPRRKSLCAFSTGTLTTFIKT